jgi:transcriptional regulator PpsR
MERDYSRFRQVEMRYRLLFELSPDSLAIVEAGNLRVVDANPAARQRFEAGGRKIVGRTLLDWFDEAGAESVQLLLSGVRAAGRGDNVRAHLAEGGPEVVVSASLVRQDNATLFLVRVANGPDDSVGVPKLKTKLLKVIENAPDAIVVTGPEGHVMTANAAFLELVHLTTEEQARGQPLDRWLGRPGIDLEVLTSNLRRHGSVRLFGTTLRAEFGAPVEVEVSAVSVMNGGRHCYGFTIRNISRRLTAEPGSRELPRSVEQLKELVGRVSLKDLVRETTDLIERRCIEAALELTDDNRASAAEMLGLSRQSLYIKLRRYGLAELNAGEN